MGQDGDTTILHGAEHDKGGTRMFAGHLSPLSHFVKPECQDIRIKARTLEVLLDTFAWSLDAYVHAVAFLFQRHSFALLQTYSNEAIYNFDAPRRNKERGVILPISTNLAEQHDDLAVMVVWRQRWRSAKGVRLTLFGKTMVLMTAEVVVNAFVWIISAIVFRRHLEGPQYRRTLSLALVAWTTGLRHGLDADHISAIDNATRRIVTSESRPVTVGLFFSLGHSTIVFATTIAVAVSVSVADHLDVYGNVGGVIGAAISGSFLVLIGCINSVILYRTYRRLKAAKRGEVATDKAHFNGLITRLAMPILRSVDKPWKLYPVGLLFGLGFDTASSIALLSAAILAQQGDQGNTSDVVLLALLFTAGMTMVDSADSCLMIWAYAPDTNVRKDRFAILARTKVSDDVDITAKEEPNEKDKDVERQHDAASPAPQQHEIANKRRQIELSASRLSLLLTLLSIMIAFAIGFIVLLGLIGDRCASCTQAADEEEQRSGAGGLAGRWWLTWRRANDNSGYVGAGIVGVFAVLVVTWFGFRWIRNRRQRNLG